MRMVCVNTTLLLVESTVISQPKVCDLAEPLRSTSLSDEIVIVETWDFVLGSNTPSLKVYPSVCVVVGVQITPII